MTRHCHYEGAWRTPEEVAQMKAAKARHPARADFDFPAVMSDIGEYQSQIDGSMITSRSQHREHLYRNGCIEVGGEMPFTRRTPVLPDKKDIAQDIKDSIDQIRSGHVPPEGPPNLDENGVIVETPDMEPIDVTNIKDGDYIRSDVNSESSIIFPA